MHLNQLEQQTTRLWRSAEGRRVLCAWELGVGFFLLGGGFDDCMVFLWKVLLGRDVLWDFVLACRVPRFVVGGKRSKAGRTVWMSL